ncbi:MAG: hypothetical protein ACYDDU_12455, partial [Dermatophilaceae bacterium]
MMPFLAPGTEGEVLFRIAAHLRDDGLIVMGFGLDRGYPIADFDTQTAAAGLELAHRFATWDLRPWHDDAPFAVTVTPTQTNPIVPNQVKRGEPLNGGARLIGRRRPTRRQTVVDQVTAWRTGYEMVRSARRPNARWPSKVPEADRHPGRNYRGRTVARPDRRQGRGGAWWGVHTQSRFPSA